MAGGADRDRPRRRLSRRTEPTPAQRALALLVRREHSRPELLRKLQARGVGPADAVAAVERMAAEGWQDDQRFAESLVRHRMATGYGPRYVSAELRLHEIPFDIADAALQACEYQWPVIAARIVRGRFPEAVDGDAPRAAREKALAWLLARGFEQCQVREMLSCR